MDPKILKISDLTDPIDTAIEFWIRSKAGRSKSQNTRRVYQNTLAHFRKCLQHQGYDLNADPNIIRLAAQGWAEQPWDKEEEMGVSNATFNQRIAILRSFYEFCLWQNFPMVQKNPIKGIPLRHVEPYQGAHPLESTHVLHLLEQIDRTTEEGERDYVILSLGFSTGRRVSELAGLRYGDFFFLGNNTRLRISWRRCKGGKSHKDLLEDHDLIQLLHDWLQRLYSTIKPQPDAAVWPSYSNNNRGRPLSPTAISEICYRRLGTYKTHTMRHTLAGAMIEAGADIQQLQAALLHEKIETTQRYMQKITGTPNPHASKIRQSFGIKPHDQTSTD